MHEEPPQAVDQYQNVLESVRTGAQKKKSCVDRVLGTSGEYPHLCWAPNVIRCLNPGQLAANTALCFCLPLIFVPAVLGIPLNSAGPEDATIDFSHFLVFNTVFFGFQTFTAISVFVFFDISRLHIFITWAIFNVSILIGLGVSQYTAVQIELSDGNTKLMHLAFSLLAATPTFTYLSIYTSRERNTRVERFMKHYGNSMMKDLTPQAAMEARIAEVELKEMANSMRNRRRASTLFEKLRGAASVVRSLSRRLSLISRGSGRQSSMGGRQSSVIFTGGGSVPNEFQYRSQSSAPALVASIRGGTDGEGGGDSGREGVLQRASTFDPPRKASFVVDGQTVGGLEKLRQEYRDLEEGGEEEGGEMGQEREVENGEEGEGLFERGEVEQKDNEDEEEEAEEAEKNEESQPNAAPGPMSARQRSYLFSDLAARPGASSAPSSPCRPPAGLFSLVEKGGDPTTSPAPEGLTFSFDKAQLVDFLKEAVAEVTEEEGETGHSGERNAAAAAGLEEGRKRHGDAEGGIHDGFVAEDKSDLERGEGGGEQSDDGNDSDSSHEGIRQLREVVSHIRRLDSRVSRGSKKSSYRDFSGQVSRALSLIEAPSFAPQVGDDDEDEQQQVLPVDRPRLEFRTDEDEEGESPTETQGKRSSIRGATPSHRRSIGARSQSVRLSIIGTLSPELVSAVEDSDYEQKKPAGGGTQQRETKLSKRAQTIRKWMKERVKGLIKGTCPHILDHQVMRLSTDPHYLPDVIRLTFSIIMATLIFLWWTYANFCSVLFERSSEDMKPLVFVGFVLSNVLVDYVFQIVVVWGVCRGIQFESNLRRRVELTAKLANVYIFVLYQKILYVRAKTWPVLLYTAFIRIFTDIFRFFLWLSPGTRGFFRTITFIPDDYNYMRSRCTHVFLYECVDNIAILSYLVFLGFVLGVPNLAKFYSFTQILLDDYARVVQFVAVEWVLRRLTVSVSMWTMVCRYSGVFSWKTAFLQTGTNVLGDRLLMLVLGLMCIGFPSDIYWSFLQYGDIQTWTGYFW
uniref:Uncharacterized protein n=1 Tax=Chromera velia CCMP2878 TaxID=1169474 RepID=A0A0G4H0G2_9ALVE|eukprot:Cvel_24192.t1-p1 / transcript=Cvel_24192.t1 / gene=Cvel_24192 / organism=Chromera_velia_CCMP2878 / gene_product=hypothetical protein / transcript_product=hypothetical protein / location=Cvel_scaffold2584:1026-6179(-) / protein_length=1022 / sequence_SO=supercontig / SO=protein_coding / is_pseudo=false